MRQMQKLRYAVDTEVETQLKVKRATVQDKIRAFQRYETLKELQTVDQRVNMNSTAQVTEDLRTIANQKQQKPSDKFRQVGDVLEELPTLTKPVQLKEAELPQEDSSDIELDVKPRQEYSLKNHLEQMHNQIMMEKEDKQYSKQQADRNELVRNTKIKDQRNREKICYCFYEELLNQVIGEPINQEVQNQYECQKKIFTDDLFAFEDCEVYQSYVKKNQQLWDSGKILNVEEVFADRFNPSIKVLEYLNSMLEGDVEFKLKFSEQFRLQGSGQQVLQKLGFPQIILIGSDEETKFDNMASFVSDNNQDMFQFGKFDEAFLQQCKVEYGDYLERCKNIQNYFKTVKPQKNTQLQIVLQQLIVNDSLMLLPVEPDKFNKALTLNQVTTEMLLLSRINYVLSRKINQFQQIVTDVCGVNSFITSNKLQIENLQQYFVIKFTQEIEYPDVFFVLNQFKTVKSVIDFELLLQFIINLKIKFLQQYLPADKKDKDKKDNSSIKQSSVDQAEILQCVNQTKQLLDQQGKAKNSQIFKSVFEQIFFITKQKSEKIDYKSPPKDVKKGVKLEDPEIILANKTIFDFQQFSDFHLVDVVDEFSNIMNIYKTSDSVFKLYTRDEFEKLIDIDFQHIQLLKPLKGELREQTKTVFEDLIQGVSKLLSQDMNIDVLIALLNDKQKNQFIYQLVYQLRNLTRPILAQLSTKLQSTLKIISLRGIKIRSQGLQLLIQNIDVLMNELQEDLSENYVETFKKENPEASRIKRLREEETQRIQETNTDILSKVTLSLEEKKHLRLTETFQDRIERLSKPQKPRQKYQKPQIPSIVTAQEFAKTRPIIVKELKQKLISQYDNQMRTQLENQAHFFRQETIDSLQDIIDQTKQFVNISDTFSTLKECQLDETNYNNVVSNFQEFQDMLLQYYNKDFVEDIVTNVRQFDEVLITQVSQQFTQLLFVTSLPFIIFANLKTLFKLGSDENNIVEEFFKTEFTDKFIESNKYITPIDIVQFLEDLYQKFGILQQSKLLYEQINKLSSLLQNSISNAQKRLVQQLEQLYLLLLQAIQQNCKQFQGVELLFDLIESYRDGFIEEKCLLDTNYKSVQGELSILDQDMQELPLLITQYQQETLVKELDATVSNTIIEQYDISKLQEMKQNTKYSDMAIKFSGMEVQFTQLIPDPNPKAKKGATIPQVHSKFFYCPLLQSQKQNKHFSLQEFSILVDYIKSQVNMQIAIPKRPTSSATNSKPTQKGKVQEVVEIYQPQYCQFGSTDIYKQMQHIVIVDKIFENKSLEFNRQFIVELVSTLDKVQVEKSKIMEYLYLWLIILAYDQNIDLFLQKIYYLLNIQIQPLSGITKLQQTISALLQLNLFTKEFQPPQPEITVQLVNWKWIWFKPDDLQSEFDQLIQVEQKQPTPQRPGSNQRGKSPVQAKNSKK